MFPNDIAKTIPLLPIPISISDFIDLNDGEIK